MRISDWSSDVCSSDLEDHKIAAAVEMIAQAKRPIVYAGGGVINAGPRACELLARFVRMLGMPCTNTLMGLGAFPGSDPPFLGMLGLHGTSAAHLARYNCAVMINIGDRFAALSDARRRGRAWVRMCRSRWAPSP